MAHSLRLCDGNAPKAAALRASWKAKATNSTDNIGTPAHEYAEAIILGRTPPKPKTDIQRLHQGMIDFALSRINTTHEIYMPEAIVFDPLFLVAGQIDLIGRNKKTGALAILDYKTCESITADSYGKRALPPIAHLPDSKVSHYAMQLSTYAYLLTDNELSSYPTQGDTVELALIHLPHQGERPVWRPVPYLWAEVDTVMRGRLEFGCGISESVDNGNAA